MPHQQSSYFVSKKLSLIFSSEAIVLDMCPDIILFPVHLPASVDWHDWSCEKVPKGVLKQPAVWLCPGTSAENSLKLSAVYFEVLSDR